VHGLGVDGDAEGAVGGDDEVLVYLAPVLDEGDVDGADGLNLYSLELAQALDLYLFQGYGLFSRNGRGFLKGE